MEAIVVSYLDIEERKRHAEQLAHLATHDELTDLPNRRVFEESLQRAVRRAGKGRVTPRLRALGTGATIRRSLVGDLHAEPPLHLELV